MTTDTGLAREAREAAQTLIDGEWRLPINVADLLTRLATAIEAATPSAPVGALREEARQHIGWIKGYAECLSAENLSDMRLRIERQADALARLLAALPREPRAAVPEAHTATSDLDVDWFVVSEAVNDAICDGEGQVGPKGLERNFKRHGLIVSHADSNPAPAQEVALVEDGAFLNLIHAAYEVQGFLVDLAKNSQPSDPVHSAYSTLASALTDVGPSRLLNGSMVDASGTVAKLLAYANDPMWADHAEVPKALLSRAARDLLAALRTAPSPTPPDVVGLATELLALAKDGGSRKWTQDDLERAMLMHVYRNPNDSPFDGGTLPISEFLTFCRDHAATICRALTGQAAQNGDGR